MHPDKNLNDRDRAEKAFDSVKKAYELLKDEERRNGALQVVQEVERRVRASVQDKRKKLKKEGYTGPLEEDDPKCYKQLLRTECCKMFAEIEVKKSEMEKLDKAYQQREDEQKKAEKTKMTFEKKAKDDFGSHERMDERVSDWRSFSASGGGAEKEKKKSRGISKPMRPPKRGPEQR